MPRIGTTTKSTRYSTSAGYRCFPKMRPDRSHTTSRNQTAAGTKKRLAEQEAPQAPAEHVRAARSHHHKRNHQGRAREDHQVHEQIHRTDVSGERQCGVAGGLVAGNTPDPHQAHRHPPEQRRNHNPGNQHPRLPKSVIPAGRTGFGCTACLTYEGKTRAGIATQPTLAQTDPQHDRHDENRHDRLTLRCAGSRDILRLIKRRPQIRRQRPPELDHVAAYRKRGANELSNRQAGHGTAPGPRSPNQSASS